MYYIRLIKFWIILIFIIFSTSLGLLASLGLPFFWSVRLICQKRSSKSWYWFKTSDVFTINMLSRQDKTNPIILKEAVYKFYIVELSMTEITCIICLLPLAMFIIFIVISLISIFCMKPPSDEVSFLSFG